MYNVRKITACIQTSLSNEFLGTGRDGACLLSGSSGRCLVLWTKWSDPAHRRASKLLSGISVPVMHKKTERTILLYCTNCHHSKANVKYFLRLCEQTFQFIRTGFSHRNRLTFPGRGWGAGTMWSDSQHSDIWCRRKSEICICHRLHPRGWVCVSLGGFSFWKDWSSFLPFWVSEYLKNLYIPNLACWISSNLEK